MEPVAEVADTQGVSRLGSLLMRLPEITAALLLAWVAHAQDLSPEVKLRVRIKLRMQEELAHLPNYTCLETLTRFVKVPRPGVRPHLEPLDTVRLEVIYTEGREWYGS